MEWSGDAAAAFGAEICILSSQLSLMPTAFIHNL